MTTTAAKSTFADIALADLRPSKTNPRKTFAPDALAELAESIRTQGIRQPILARPKAGETPYEIVAGERRYRAAQLAELTAVPVLVSEMTDREALEVQVVENLQRTDLNELEEAASYQAMLDLKDEATGAPVYDGRTLAARLGVSPWKIYQSLHLLNLPPAGRAALEEGKLGARQLMLIGRIPDPAAREKALEEVMAPRFSTEPLTYRATEELIHRDYMQSLKGAPFKLDDAELLPEAGPCATCPKMSDNCTALDEAERAKNKRVCLDPACFRAKRAAAWQKRSAAAEAEGKVALDTDASAKVFPEIFDAGEVDRSSGYELLSEKPSTYLLKPEVVDSVGSWRSLIETATAATAQKAMDAAKSAILENEGLTRAEKREALDLLEKTPPAGMTVPICVARDQTGAAREVVEVKLAIALIEASGEPLFVGTKSSMPAAGDSFADERKRQAEAAKERLAKAIAAVSFLHEELYAGWEPSGVWEGLFPIALEHAGHDGAYLIAKWQGLKYENTGTAPGGLYDVVTGWAAKLTPAERQALVPILLMSQRLKNSGPGEELETFIQAAGIKMPEEAAEAEPPFKSGDIVEWGAGHTEGFWGWWYPQAEAEKKTGEKALEKLGPQQACVVRLQEGSLLLNLMPAARLRIVESWEADIDYPGCPEAALQSTKDGMPPEPEDRGVGPADRARRTRAKRRAAPITLTAQEAGQTEPVTYQQTEAERAADAQVAAIDRAQRPLDELINEALPGTTTAARATIAAKYIKRVCGAEKPEAELTPQERFKIAEALGMATAGKSRRKAQTAEKEAA